MPIGTSDIHEVKTLIAEVKSNFEKLPDKVKLFFKNKAENALEYMQDPKNIENSIKMGLISEEYLPKKQEPEKIQKVQVITPEPEKKPAEGQAAGTST